MTSRKIFSKSNPAVGLRSHDVVVRGRASILKVHSALVEFCNTCGQDGRLDDLPYFLAKPGILSSEPVLFLLLKAPVPNLGAVQADDIFGAVLLYEYRLLGLRLKAMAVVDRAGGALIGLPENRVRIAARMRDVLTRMGVHMAILSVDATGQADPLDQMLHGVTALESHQWKTRHRNYAGYLELQSTFDATLATINQKTRFNLRYYRRRAEKEFGSHFLAEASISLSEFIEFNKVSSHPVPDSVLRRRLESQTLLQRPVLAGVKDKDGRWLSILAARRNGDRSEILWQMNRSGLPQHSLGTVMRSYFIENEIEQGVHRLYVEQGTPHLMKTSFVHRDLYDLVLVRRSAAGLLQRLTRKFLHSDNPLAEILQDEASEWRVGGKPKRDSKLRAQGRGRDAQWDAPLVETAF